MAWTQPPYQDRADAGRVLAGLLAAQAGPDTLILAVPNGGVAVAAPLALALDAPLRLMVVRKIQIPGNPEAGFGAVAADGSTVMNRELAEALKLSPAQVAVQRNEALASIRSRLDFYGAWARLPESLAGLVALLVDDGLASGATMAAAVGIVRAKAPRRVVVAAPTASLGAARRLEALADELVCPDVRSGPYFAVAEAYARWRDLEPAEALALLEPLRGRPGNPA